MFLNITLNIYSSSVRSLMSRSWGFHGQMLGLAGIMDWALNRWNVCTVCENIRECPFGFLEWRMLRSDHRKGMRLSHRISKTSSEWRIKGSCSSSRPFPMRLTLHFHLWAVRSIRQAHLCVLHHRHRLSHSLSAANIFIIDAPERHLVNANE